VSDLLRIAVSGLVANQAALNTTGHNISNAGVEGYSRQRVDLVTRPPQFERSGYFGRGVDVQTVERLVDDFVTRQLRTDTWVFNSADTFRFYAEQIDKILTDPSVGLSGRIDGFFAAFHSGADDPVWIPTRQVVLEETRTLAERFNNMYARLAETNAAMNQQLDALAGDADALALGIADLNLKIAIAVGVGGGSDQPNDLLDQRDRKLAELAELVDITTVRDGEAINVFLGRGQALVVGSIASRVTTVQGVFDPERKDLAVVVNGQASVVSDETTGGKIGGILGFRDRVLDQAFNQIGRVAIGIVADVNAQHALGMDLDGDLGGLVFGDVNGALAPVMRARAAGDNDPASTGVVTVQIDDPSQLTTSGYRLDVLAGGSWRLFREQDRTVVASGAALTDPLASVDGFTLNLNLASGGTFADGDSFLIEPTRYGAKDIGVAITRPEDLAFAQPVRAAPAAANTGQGRIDVTAVLDTSLPLFQTTPGQLSPPLLIRFTSATTFDVLDNTDPANPVALVPPLVGLAFAPGVSNTLFSTDPLDPDYFGFQLSITGDPQAGDDFAIDFNTGGVSDNRNALALAKMQIATNLVNDTATYQGAYGQLVGYVGSETRRARIDTDAARTLVEQTRAAREEVSGVNLDEEAADLVRYQQAYSAAAQVIAIARSVIDTLLEATG
jgi:flagellar hook-associated protein 1 FlgK